MRSQFPIKRFVQNVLGCNCPDEVFKQIEIRNVQSPTSPHTRNITIGGRLLIYIWKADERKEIQEGLIAMLEAGKRERDARGLNRFRAVLAVEHPQTLESQINYHFSQFENKDEGLHIHVIHVNDLKNFQPV